MKVDKNAKLERLSLLLQPPRLVREETEMLMGVFGDSPEVYLAVRDLFFGFELEDSQQLLLAQVKKISPLMRKIFLPEVKKGIAFGNTFDLWQTKDLQTDLLEAGKINIEAKQLMISFLEASLARLENLTLPGIDLSVKPELGFIHGRNGYISYIDNQIRFLMQHVNMQTMTQEEIKTLMAVNSTK